MERYSRAIVQWLQAEVFELVKVSGSHHKFRKGPITMIVPHPKKDLPAGRLVPSPSRPAGCKECWTMHYVAVIDKDVGSAYGVRFPDVPGCFSAADTFNEIIPNAIEALSLFFEGREIIPARSIEEVREEVAEDLATGAVLMMIPYIADRRRVVRVNLSLDQGLLDTMDEAARARGMTRSAFVAKAATREIYVPG